MDLTAVSKLSLISFQLSVTFRSKTRFSCFQSSCFIVHQMKVLKNLSFSKIYLTSWTMELNRKSTYQNRSISLPQVFKLILQNVCSDKRAIYSRALFPHVLSQLTWGMIRINIAFFPAYLLDVVLHPLVAVFWLRYSGHRDESISSTWFFKIGFGSRMVRDFVVGELLVPLVGSFG